MRTSLGVNSLAAPLRLRTADVSGLRRVTLAHSPGNEKWMTQLFKFEDGGVRLDDFRPHARFTKHLRTLAKTCETVEVGDNFDDLPPRQRVLAELGVDL